MIMLMIMSFLSPMESFAAKKKYSSWQEVALDMSSEFDSAIKSVESDDYKAAYDFINDAYFGYYEVQGFEKNVMAFISQKRVSHIEGRFRDIKHSLLGNIDSDKDNLIKSIEIGRAHV